jgi:flagellar protein FliO/FliZ
VRALSPVHAAGRRLAAAAVWLLTSAATALAQPAATPAHKFAAPAAAPAVSGPAGSLVQVTLSLVLVLAAVFAAAWILRRLRMGGGKRETGAIAIVAEQAVGPRERVVLLQVGNDRVLVGVASGSVRALHTLRDASSHEGAP